METTTVEDVRATAERLTAAADEARREVDKARAALAAAKDAVEEVTTRLTATDVSTPAFGKLVTERYGAAAHVEALGAQLEGRMTLLAAARDAVAESARALDVVDFEVAKEDLVAALTSLEQTLVRSADEAAEGLELIAKRYRAAEILAARTKANFGSVEFLFQGAVGRRFEELLAAAQAARRAS